VLCLISFISPLEEVSEKSRVWDWNKKLGFMVMVLKLLRILFHELESKARKQPWSWIGLEVKS
jgi:cytochrome b561